jgi:hypothetical protein
MKAFHLVLFAGLLLATGTSYARSMRAWTYDDLLKESDLVVIASVVDTKVVPTTDDLSANGLGRSGYHIQQLETVFLVKVVLKGKHQQKRLDLVHFRYDPKVNEPILNGPTLIEFPNSDQIAKSIEGNKRGYGKDYLLFLKLRKDGKCGPVTGQVDPLFSIRELGNPSELTLPQPSK